MRRRSRRFSGLFCDLELDWPLGLLLHDDRTSRDAITVCYVPHPQLDQIARPQLAIDCQVE